ncbi:uncharacterized protein LOC142983824 [Anticarsia gemmatalis]|uniref:uncharacterized protein LOC142983824 n=1 Tax=Anticarsia gemmatalis TaxID=129554 RepID=UPI003F75FA68
MSSEDVIELGSSDEETEPAPKKSKPLPNAMVCIPRKYHDVTIKPTKVKPSSFPKGLEMKPITVKTVSNTKQLMGSIKKLNGKPSDLVSKPRLGVNPFSGQQKPVLIQNKPSNSNIKYFKVVSPRNIITNKAPPGLLKNPIRIQNAAALNLPPSITVKKTVSNRPVVLLNVKSKQQINQRNNPVGEVLTVQLDDDDAPPHKSGPQWYLRPEEQTDTPTPEEENNKEPEAPKFIEITIEDSPVKPVSSKSTHEVGAELAITIDDSPAKSQTSKKRKGSFSDNEKKRGAGSVPHSKKKLKYPKEFDNRKTVEIEIDPLQIGISNDICHTAGDTVVNIDDESISSESGMTQTNIQEKCNTTPSKENTIEVQSSPSEFHPVYQSFIDLCFQLENSDDMKKIVEKKIKGYYRQVPKEYTESEEFTDMVSSKILSMKASPEKMYLYIKDIVDELNLQRKLCKAQPVVKEIKNEEPMQIYDEESEYDSKRQRQIRKLEKTIKKLHRAIQKLEEQEVDFDDDDDSVYLLTERYKERMVRVYAKFCQMSNTKMPSEPRILLDARPGRPSGPAKRLEKWINKKVPIGTPLPFPDFHDVLRCVRQANDEDKLGFNEADIMEEARDLFTRCGKKLQRRRQENEWRLAASRIAVDVDPAENNDDLKKKLMENQRIAAQKETEIFNKFADRQNQLKLEAEEIGDKEAEESPIESEEEDVNEESGSLENTEKRKERLKRLIQEKAKKTDEKENQPSNKDEAIESITQTPEEVQAEDVNKENTENKDSENKTEEDNKMNVDESPNDDKTIPNETETYILSDDSNELRSDIDELHLLQKLHSENEEHSSTVDTSDSESAIDISDSLESGDNKEQSKELSDVISIENSSYSENEDEIMINTQVSNTDSVQLISEDNTLNESAVPVDESAITAESSKAGSVQATHTNNDEYNEAVENILLASSEEDDGDSQDAPCVNLRDDLISIDETCIGGTSSTDIRTQEQPKSATSDETITTKVNTDEVPVIENQAKENLDSSKSTECNESSTKSNGEVCSEKSNKSVETMDVEHDDVEEQLERLFSPTGNDSESSISIKS